MGPGGLREGEWGAKGAKKRNPASGVIQHIILLKANNKNLSESPLCCPFWSLVCLYSCSMMACKYHHLNSQGQAEGKKEQDAWVMDA